MIATIVGTIAIIGVTIALGILLDRKVGILPRPKQLLEAGRPGFRLPSHAPGAAPETALARAPREVRCSACLGHTELDGESPATYDNRELVVGRYRCKCTAITTVYSTAHPRIGS